MALPPPVFDALLAAQAREEMPTTWDSRALQQVDAEIRRRSVFAATMADAWTVSQLKQIVDQLAGDEIGEAQAIAALLQAIRATGYTPEGGFPSTPPGKVDTALAGSIQDLSSFRRAQLIIQTQQELAQGAGQQIRGQQPERLRDFPAYELVRIYPRVDQRLWYVRFRLAGGTVYPHDGTFSELYGETGCIALKGDPVWAKLGSKELFDDALDTDHAPFAFQSGVGLQEVSRERCERLGVVASTGESIDEFQAKQPRTQQGQLPLPAVKISLKGMDPEVIQAVKDSPDLMSLGAEIDLNSYTARFEEMRRKSA